MCITNAFNITFWFSTDEFVFNQSNVNNFVNELLKTLFKIIIITHSLQDVLICSIF